MKCRTIHCSGNLKNAYGLLCVHCGELLLETATMSSIPLKAAPPQPPLMRLPPDVAPTILSFLTPQEVGSFSQINSQFNNTISHGPRPTFRKQHFDSFFKTRLNPIVASAGCSLVLSPKGEIWATGSNGLEARRYLDPIGAGHAGMGDKLYNLEFMDVTPAATRFTRLSSGFRHSLALSSKGNIWACGENLEGELGSGKEDKGENNFVNVTSHLPFFTTIFAGDYYSLALDLKGQIWFTGSFNIGNGIDNPKAIVFTPLHISPIGVCFIAIEGGDGHCLALSEDGQIWAIGSNYRGQLGAGNIDHSPVFINVTPDSIKFTAIAVRAEHSLALSTTRQVWATGNNGMAYTDARIRDCAIGLGQDIENVKRFRPVTPPSVQFKSITTNQASSLALSTLGQIWATGRNKKGQFGTSDNQNKNVFTPVTSIEHHYTAISIGFDHTLALDINEDLYGAGNNSDGALGAGENESQPSLVFKKITMPGSFNPIQNIPAFAGIGSDYASAAASGRPPCAHPYHSTASASAASACPACHRS